MADTYLNVILESTEIVEHLLNYFRAHANDYDLPALTNKRVSSQVSILDVHPLAMETGRALAGDGTSYQSVLPAIGVEVQSDMIVNERVGAARGETDFKIVQDWITEAKAETMKERYADGNLVSSATIAQLEAAFNAVAPKPLWGKCINIMHQPTVVVSVWSDDPQVTRILNKVVLALVHRVRKELTRKAVLTTISVQSALYNFDFARMLIGCDITITPTILMKLLEVNVTSPTSTLRQAELTYPQNTLTRSGSTAIGPTFVAPGDP